MTEIFGSKRQPELHTNGIFSVLLFTWFLLTRYYLSMQNFKDVIVSLERKKLYLAAFAKSDNLIK